jgi:hypothetical protein
MFPLYSKTFPKTADELAILLNGSVGRVFASHETPVTVRGDAYPQLEAIRITLDRAELLQNPPPPPRPNGTGTAALEVGELQLQAEELSLGPATADLRLHARDVHLHQAKDRAGEIVLLLHRARDGEIEVSADKNQIERAIATLATSEAGKHGVAIDHVQLNVRSRGDRSVDAEVQVRAKKLFFSTTVRISAKLDLDDELNATLSGLACAGDGAIGSLACGFLQPHLQAMDGRTFPLMALPLGEVKLRDVRLATGDRLTVRAEFGA